VSEDVDEDSQQEHELATEKDLEEHMVPQQSDHSNDTSELKQPLSPRQPLDCIPVETVLQEQNLPESSYLSAGCFGQTDHGHSGPPSPEQIKCK